MRFFLPAVVHTFLKRINGPVALNQLLARACLISRRYWPSRFSRRPLPGACCCSLGYSTEGSSPSVCGDPDFSRLPLQRRLLSSRVAQSPTSGQLSSATHFWLPPMGFFGTARGSSTVRTSQSSWFSQVCCCGLLPAQSVPFMLGRRLELR